MPTYTVNEAGVAHARELIDARQYVLRSEWGRVQPAAEDENEFLTHPPRFDPGSTGINNAVVPIEQRTRVLRFKLHKRPARR